MRLSQETIQIVRLAMLNRLHYLKSQLAKCPVDSPSAVSYARLLLIHNKAREEFNDAAK